MKPLPLAILVLVAFTLAGLALDVFMWKRGLTLWGFLDRASSSAILAVVVYVVAKKSQPPASGESDRTPP